MSITTEEKQKVIGKYQTNDKDTGSSNVQVALLTNRIKDLTDHFNVHKKDHHSRRGLLVMVAKRRKLLTYIRKKDYQQYLDIIGSLKLRK
ncbi:MAG: 30S ribosomal protein S15 [Candidatus Aminicenantes bacterium]|nr:30S ribosomal protein S15 [Candidatus Aminicenantes bacterium]